MGPINCDRWKALGHNFQKTFHVLIGELTPQGIIGVWGPVEWLAKEWKGGNWKLSPENLLQLFLIASSADDRSNDQELLQSSLQSLKLVMMINMKKIIPAFLLNIEKLFQFT